MAYCLTARKIVLSTNKWKKQLYKTIFVFYGWKICVLASRISALSLLVIALKNTFIHPVIFCICILIHWVIAFGDQLMEHFSSCSFLDVSFIGILAIVHCFDVVTVKPRSRKDNSVQQNQTRFAIWYWLFFLENISALVTWLILDGEKPLFLEVIAANLVVTTFFFGMIFMLTYFRISNKNTSE